VPVVVTAGARLPEAFAAAVGTAIKAAAPVGGKPLLDHVVNALRAAEGVGAIAVVGPVEALRGGTGAAPDHWVEEGATGPENVERGLKALAAREDSRSDGSVLLSASDLPFLHADAVRWLLEHAPGDADIVYPVIRRADHEASFPGSPNVWTPLADGHYTGGSVLLVRPAAIERNRTLIERVFAARKSQIGMAWLLGLPFVAKFARGRLTVAEAEARASRLTGCRCRALVGADPRLGVDIDTWAEYQWAERHVAAGAGGDVAPRKDPSAPCRV
jgi:CTP:molybdopterin cytidylyltransferase MocA